ncbi:hypothetical protein LC040_15540 [Bacillus tianshenii]|nr:hypothetical protein LC040_15540 [Bacillus tianshenii]
MYLFQVKTKPHGVQRYEQFIADDCIGIGWPGIGSLKDIRKEELRDRLREVYDLSGAKLGNALGAVWAFSNTMQEGNIVVIRKGTLLSIGIVGDYKYVQQLDNENDGFCHQRSVKWLVINERTSLYNEKLLETLNHRGIVTKCKYEIEELDLEIHLKKKGERENEFVSNEK